MNCIAASKYDLIRNQPAKGHCVASILHMMLDDVIYAFAELISTDVQPLVLAGTLLGGYRNGTIIRWSRDVDLMYNSATFLAVKDKLKKKLYDLGYSLFFEGIWRVCVSPDHALAPRIYDATRCRTAKPGYQGNDVPYVDLYGFHERHDGFVKIDAHEGLIRRTSLFPTSDVHILGKEYKTISRPADYFDFVKYGNFMVERNDGYR